MVNSSAFACICEPDEQLLLCYRDTDQVIVVSRSAYLAGRDGKYRNWRLYGHGRFLSPPRTLSHFLAGTVRH